MQVVASREEAMSRANSWERKADSFREKPVIYLPALVFAASGAQVYKRQAEGSLRLPFHDPLVDIGLQFMERKPPHIRKHYKNSSLWKRTSNA
jgi:hypothetical protein